MPLSLLLLLLFGCDPAAESNDKRPNTSLVLRLAVTTSTRDTGLVDVLARGFEKEHACRVDVIALGSGKALKLGERGDVDVLLTHAPDAETRFMNTGHGQRREQVMFNTFVILGPPNDPAAIADSEPIEALQRIAGRQYCFVSRGDDSGTHKRELVLWEAARIRPNWDRYIEGGQGMGSTLIMADQLQAYTLCDNSTYLVFRDKIELIPLLTSGELLINTYSVISVNPTKHNQIKRDLAEDFVDFLISSKAQEIIRTFTVNGDRLFHPLRLENRTGGQ